MKSLQISLPGRGSVDEDRLSKAGDWMLRLGSEDLEEYELLDWVDWYLAQPGNIETFDALQEQFELYRMAPRETRRSLAGRLAMRGGFLPMLSRGEPILGESLRRAWSWIKRHPMMLAGFAVLFAAGASIGHWYFESVRADPLAQTAVYQTRRAEHRDVRLPDGSWVHLGASSSISFNFTDEMRYLVLEGGEAFFEVAHESRRPFIVQSGGVSVKAVGTAFNVRRAAERVAVTVSKGRVDIVRDGESAVGARIPLSPLGAHGFARRSVRVNAGEQVWVNATQSAIMVMPADPGTATAWQLGRLEFIGEPLRVVVATVNRYSPREIIITEESLGEVIYTGTVQDSRIDEWLQALQMGYPIRVAPIGTDTILLSPDATRSAAGAPD